MPNCFQLIRKSDLAAGPVKLNVIDEELCKHFNVEVHPKHWYMSWYNDIGWSLAMGKSFNDIRESYAKILADEVECKKYDLGTSTGKEYFTKLIEVVNYLDEHFTSSAWYSVHKQ